MSYLINIFIEAWRLLVESAPYMLLGIVFGGLLKVFLSPGLVVRHLGHGRIMPVIKAAILGIPIPLCSCGVLPAAAAIKRQGANNGATAAFLISTPESGVDSIAISYALLGPVMAVARPAAAFFGAAVAGIAENLLGRQKPDQVLSPDLSCPVDGCCDGLDCPPEVHAHHHTLVQRLAAGFKFSFGEMWGDLAGWFLIGLLLAGAITAFVPPAFMARFLGGGISSMLVMLAVGIPLYICATASTPVAAALILKGVSPGAALVFLLTGPATNITSLTMLTGLLGKRATAIYLASIAATAVIAGLVLDWLILKMGLNVTAALGRASEILPDWLGPAGAVLLLALSIKPVWLWLKAKLGLAPGHDHDHDHGSNQGRGQGAEPKDDPFTQAGSGPSCTKPT